MLRPHMPKVADISIGRRQFAQTPATYVVFGDLGLVSCRLRRPWLGFVLSSATLATRALVQQCQRGPQLRVD